MPLNSTKPPQPQPPAGARPPGSPLQGPIFEAMLRLWAARGGEREFPVVGESMHPILEKVQGIRASMGASRVRFGDIVLFYRDGNLIAHRALLRNAQGFRTRGDGRRGFDRGRVDPEEVLGVVTHLTWKDRTVPLSGPGAASLRVLQGVLSLAAGWLRIDPGGPRPDATLAGRLRDRLLGPPYRGALRRSFVAHAAVSRTIRRLHRVVLRRPGRDLLPLLHPGRAPAARIVRGLPWPELVRGSIRLGMGPLLMQRLRAEGLLDQVPEDARRSLERTYYAHALYNTKMLAELNGIVESFEAEGIEPILLKGAAHLGGLYPNVALRVLSDLDLLLHEREIERADRILRARGYLPDTRTFSEEFYRGHHHVPPYVPPRGHPRVELHTGLVAPSVAVVLDLEGMRRRALPWGGNDARGRVLCPSDQLIHACVHLALSDNFVRGVKDLVDIDRLARLLDGDAWGLVREQARPVRIGRAVHYCLVLARRVLATPVPEEVRREIRRHRLPAGEDLLLRQVSYRYLTTWPEQDEFFGLATAKRVVELLLEQPGAPRRMRRLLRILRAAEGHRPPKPHA